MPRSVRERIFYERVSAPKQSCSWSVRCFRKLARTYFGVRPCSGPSVKIRKGALYIKALAFERNIDNRRFDSELRKGSEVFSFKDINRRALLFEARKTSEREASCKLKEKSYDRSLASYKDGQ